METTTDGGTTLRYELSGGDGPAVAFVPEAAFGPWAWGWQAPALTGAHRTLVYAPRGTDGSDRAGPYTVDRFAADLEAVANAAGVRRLHVVGAGLGAAIALRYAREYGRARSLALFGATDSGERVDPAALSRLHPDPDDRAALEAALEVAFTDRFRAESELCERIVGWRRGEDAAGEARAGHLRAAQASDPGPLYEHSLPTLVCHGVDDPVVPAAAGEALADALPRGRFEPIEGRRCCYIEHAAAVTDALEGFFADVGESRG